MISWSRIGKILSANCQMTAADLAAIAVIRNNAVWIHGLIKHCPRSWTDKFGHFYAWFCEMTGQGTPVPRKHVNNFRCDLFRDAGKTTWSWAMNTYRVTIPRSINFENIAMDSCANFCECPFVAFHARSCKPRWSGIHSVKFSKWRTPGNHADASAFHQPKLKSFQIWAVRNLCKIMI